jgi:glucose/arabinose dehydrogenase
MRRVLLASLFVACTPRSRATSARPDASRPLPPPTVIAPSLPRDACTGVSNALALRLRPGFCVRPIATGLLKPRQLARGVGAELLVAESGPGWRHNRGRVSSLRPLPDGTYAHTVLVEGLDRPHGIAFRDGYVWVAEAGRIARFRHPAEGAAAVETVLGDLPNDGRHPHKTLAFSPDGTLYFSVGSATDNCQVPNAHEALDPCPERSPVAPALERGVVMRWDARRARAAVFSRGLRNTLGLAWHPQSARLYGVENARDYIDRADPALSDAALPHDELNELVRDGDHGWPYCYDDNVVSPEYRADPARCRATRAPAIDLPAHSAPISMAFYDGAMFPAAYRGAAFVTYHGYRAEGHRVVVIPFSAEGAPSGTPEDFISGWEERPGRPHGHLTGLAVTDDGSLALTDDVGGAVYLVRYGASALHTPPPVVTAAPVEDPAVVDRRCTELARRSDLLSVMQRTVIDTKCVSCHAMSAGAMTLRRCDWRMTWEAFAHGRSAVYGPYVVPGRVDQGVLMARLHGDTMGPRMPMLGVSLTTEELGAVEAWVRAGAPSP